MKNQSKIRNPKSKILIVGAGPAGASLAIRLRKENFRVVLIEREKFPRAKLCGEFISPECLEHFRALGVLDEMLSAGGERVAETVFYAPGGKGVSIPSRWLGGDFSGALSLSRAEMDFRLLKKAGESGVEILEETSAVDLILENKSVRGVKVKNKSGETSEITADLTVDATGRGGVLGKYLARNQIKVRSSKLKVQSSKNKIRNRLVGFKAHLKNVSMEKGTCEIYFFRGGYGGVTFVEGGLANHCFLIRAEVVKEFKGDAEKIVENVVLGNKRAFAALKNAESVSGWLAVSIDEFGEKDLCPAPGLFTVGDASAFIDPFTGSGMLMALEGSGILAQIIAEKGITPEERADGYRILHRRKFQKRLRFCSLMRRAASFPTFVGFAISALSLSAGAREFLARSTRNAFSAGGIKK